MQVLTSGQAGVFAIQTPEGFTVERLDTGEVIDADSRSAKYFFLGCTDTISVRVDSVEHARQLTEIAWSADRAVRMFVILLDPTEDLEDLVEVGEVLEDLLAYDKVEERVEAQIFSSPLPNPISVTTVSSALDRFPKSTALFSRFLDLQSNISRVRKAFDSLDSSLFENEERRQFFLEQAIDRGAFRALTIANAEGEGVETALFEVYGQLKDLENNREIITNWTQGFDRTRYQLEDQSDWGNGDLTWSESEGVTGRQAYERVLVQQSAIIDRIRQADFDKARRFATELVDFQKRTGGPEHIAMSLDRLSQEAKELNIIDLALEWAFAAVEAKGDDPKAHAQLADLLMRVGRYTEAERSLDLAESFGEERFAATGRARILRYKGQYEAALARYREALKQSDFANEHAHIDLAGVAECLRDLERYDEALAQYDDALERFPYESVLHAGKASTLVDIGRFDEALRSYRTAINYGDKTSVPRNGVASLFRRSGKLVEAEARFREILEDYPFDSFAWRGLVATLRDMGNYRDAVDEALLMRERVPSSPDGWWSLADAQIDAGLYDDALETLNSANRAFRHVAGLRAGRARLEKAKGNYPVALTHYENAFKDFPSNSWLLIGKADMLRLLGQSDEALGIYERYQSHQSVKQKLQNAIASIHLNHDRFDQAKKLLTIDDPKSSEEWRNLALGALLDLKERRHDLARQKFQAGVEKCVFYRERNIFRAGLARLMLDLGRMDQALQVSSECEGDVAEIIRLHVVAAQKNNAEAYAIYHRQRADRTLDIYGELREQIAARYQLVDSQPIRSVGWINEREVEMLVLEAA